MSGESSLIIEELNRLHNSIKYDPTPPRNVLYTAPHPIFLNKCSIANVHKKLCRIYSEEELEPLSTYAQLLSTPGSVQNEYSEDFAYWFFIHWRAIMEYGDKSDETEFNCLSTPLQFYVNFFCPKLLQIKFDSDFNLFSPYIEVKRRSDDFGLTVPVGEIVNEKQKHLIVCIGGAAKDGFDYWEHKDRNKLHHCMRMCIDDQLDHVPIEKCRVIGLLYGGSMVEVEVFEMKPRVTSTSKIVLYDAQKIYDRLMLKDTGDLARFYSLADGRTSCQLLDRELC